MSAVVAALIPVFLLMAAGALARRFLVTEEDHWVGIERLVYFLLFPALLIDTLALADLSKVPARRGAMAPRMREHSNAYHIEHWDHGNGGNRGERKAELAVEIARYRERGERLPPGRALEQRGVGRTVDAQPPNEKRP